MSDALNDAAISSPIVCSYMCLCCDSARDKLKMTVGSEEQSAFCLLERMTHFDPSSRCVHMYDVVPVVRVYVY